MLTIINFNYYKVIKSKTFIYRCSSLFAMFSRYYTREQIIEAIRRYICPIPYNGTLDDLLTETGNQKLKPAFQEIVHRKPSHSQVGQSREGILRVSSWNIEEGKNIEDVINTIKSDEYLVNSDVLLLQELPRTINGKDIPELLAERTGFGFIYSPWRITLADNSQVGNMILSRHQISEQSRIELSSGYDWYKASGKAKLGYRMALKGKITKNGNGIWIYCVHLEAYTRPDYRYRQMKEVLEDAVKHHGSPIVIGGDANFGPFEPFMLMRRNGFDDHIRRTWTSTMNDFWFEYLFGFQLDRIYSRGFRRENSKMPKAKVLKDIKYSDHRAITVDLMI